MTTAIDKMVLGIFLMISGYFLASLCMWSWREIVDFYFTPLAMFFDWWVNLI